MAEVVVGIICYGGKEKKWAISSRNQNFHLRSGDLRRRAKALPKRKLVLHPTTPYNNTPPLQEICEHLPREKGALDCRQLPNSTSSTKTITTRLDRKNVF